MIFNLFVLYLLIVSFFSFKGHRMRRLYYFNCFLIICFVGLRGYDIGSVDTLNYVRFFLGQQKDYHITDKDIEIGLSIFNGIIKPFIKTGWLYLFIVAFISLFPLFYLIKEKSSNQHFSILLLFLVLGNIISLYFICMRQVLGMSLLLWGIIIWLNKPKYYRLYYIIFLVLGWFFHSVIILPGVLFIILFYFNISRKIYAGIAVLSFFIGILGVFDDFSMFMFLFSYSGGLLDLLSNYATIEFKGSAGYLYPTFRTILCLLICFVCSKKDYSHIFSKMFLVGVVLSNTFLTFQEMYRLAGLFTVFGVIPISAMATSLFGKYIYNTDKIVRFQIIKIFRFLLIAIVVYSYCNYYESNMKLQNKLTENNATLIPYYFFWEDKYSF